MDSDADCHPDVWDTADQWEWIKWSWWDHGPDWGQREHRSAAVEATADADEAWSRGAAVAADDGNLAVAAVAAETAIAAETAVAAGVGECMPPKAFPVASKAQPGTQPPPQAASTYYGGGRIKLEQTFANAPPKAVGKNGASPVATPPPQPTRDPPPIHEEPPAFPPPKAPSTAVAAVGGVYHEIDLRLPGAKAPPAGVPPLVPPLPVKQPPAGVPGVKPPPAGEPVSYQPYKQPPAGQPGVKPPPKGFKPKQGVYTASAAKGPPPPPGGLVPLTLLPHHLLRLAFLHHLPLHRHLHRHLQRFRPQSRQMSSNSQQPLQQIAARPK